MNFEKLKLRVELVKTQVDILKLKANDHDWSCYVPGDVKASLERSLVDIAETLKELDQEAETQIELPALDSLIIPNQHKG